MKRTRPAVKLADPMPHPLLAAVDAELEWIQRQTYIEARQTGRRGYRKLEHDPDEGSPLDPVIPKKFDRARFAQVQFYAALAGNKKAKLGPRGSGLIRHIVNCITWSRTDGRESKLNRYGIEKAWERDTLENFGRAVGVSRRQAWTYLQEAERLGLLKVRQVPNAVEVRIADSTLILSKEQVYQHVRFYDRELADVLGVNGAIIYAYIRARGAKGQWLSFVGFPNRRPNLFVTSLPWMTAPAIRLVVLRLEKGGWITRVAENRDYKMYLYTASKKKV